MYPVLCAHVPSKSRKAESQLDRRKQREEAEERGETKTKREGEGCCPCCNLGLYHGTAREKPEHIATSHGDEAPDSHSILRTRLLNIPSTIYPQISQPCWQPPIRSSYQTRRTRPGPTGNPMRPPGPRATLPSSLATPDSSARDRT